MTLDAMAWLLLVPPVLSFWLIVLFFNRWKRVSHTIAIGAAFITFVLAQLIVIAGLRMGAEALAASPIHSLLPWLPTGTTVLSLGVWIDPLTIALLFFVSITVLAIFVYSVGYMHGDPKYSRFFAFISLFAFGMFGLVVADDLLMLFIFWEIMGLCSYLLIGFWYHKPSAYRAAVKAFLTTRIGDVFMLLGIAYLYSQTGTLSYDVLFRNHEVLQRLATTPSVIGGLSVAALAGLLLFAGTVGKSAQFPLHVWLPDAMEGPTPVSAMIHAATMVSAGVYLVIRAFPLLSAGLVDAVGTPPMLAMGLIGAFTAFFAATMAVAQNDIKRVLAYSTISQLGYMIAALGVGAYVAAAFHLVAHAFFKALLFLGSGSVIVGMHHHQDMMEMGGLRTKMPITFWTFVAGGFALSGFPIITAGFWSKDEILAQAFHAAKGGSWLGWFVYILLALGALLTAFYTMRQISLTFLGEPRSEHAEHAHETPWTMTAPLVVLAFFALTFGFAGVPEDFPLLGPLFGGNFFHHFVGATLLEEEPPMPLDWVPLSISILFALGGLFLGWWVYGRRPLEAGAPDPLERPLGKLYTVLKNKYYVDEFYDRTFIQPTIHLGAWVYKWIDRGLIDGILHAAASAAMASGRLFAWVDRVVVNGGVDSAARGIGWMGEEGRRGLQTGLVQDYIFILAVFVILFVLVYFVRGAGL